MSISLSKQEAKQKAQQEALAVSTLSLCVIVGALLRLYKLDVPSMWWDEILVPLTARYPIPYIMKFSQSCEIHPPLFHLLTKMVMMAGNSDFILRIIPALAGIVSIPVLYRVGREYLGVSSALLASALLAVDPLHISLSRQVRPYTLEIFACIILLHFLKQFIDHPSKSKLFQLVAINASLLLLHYNANLIIASEMVLVFAINAIRGRKLLGNYLIPLALMAILSLGLVLPFALPYAMSHTGIVRAEPFLKILGMFTSNLAKVFNLLPFQGVFIPALIAFAAGAILFFREDRVKGVICLGFPLLALALLLALGYGSFFNPWHLSFLLPCILLGVSRPFRDIPAARLVLPGLCVLLLAVGLWSFSTESKGSYEIGGNSDLIKERVKRLVNTFPAGQALFAEISDLNTTAWYLKQFEPESGLISPAIDAAETYQAALPANEGQWQRFIKADPEFVQNFGEPKKEPLIHDFSLYSWTIPRSNGVLVDSLPFDKRWTMTPTEFCKTAVHAQGLLPVEGSVMAVRNDAMGIYDTTFINGSHDTTPQIITVVMGYTNYGQNNLLTLEAWFDDEPPIATRNSIGPDPIQDAGFVIQRDKPYKRMNLRVSMTVAPFTPSYPGGNQQTLGLQLLEVSIKRAL